jgi:hypothetical protein
MTDKYESNLKEWGDIGTEPPSGYNYSDARPVDEFDDWWNYHTFEDIVNLFNLLQELDNNKASDVHGNEAHTSNFASIGETADDPHGNSAHTEDYIPESTKPEETGPYPKKNPEVGTPTIQDTHSSADSSSNPLFWDNWTKIGSTASGIIDGVTLSIEMTTELSDTTSQWDYRLKVEDNDGNRVAYTYGTGGTLEKESETIMMELKNYDELELYAKLLMTQEEGPTNRASFTITAEFSRHELIPHRHNLDWS